MGKPVAQQLDGTVEKQTVQAKVLIFEQLFQKRNPESATLFTILVTRLAELCHKLSVEEFDGEIDFKKVKEAYRQEQKALQNLNLAWEFWTRYNQTYKSMEELTEYFVPQPQEYDESNEDNKSFQAQQKAINQQLRLCEIHMEIKRGETNLKDALEEAEELDVDMVYMALDNYKQAGTMAIDVDQELEAICCANLGKIYYKILKNTSKARSHLYDAVRVANTLWPKNFEEMAWFRKAKQHLQEIRDKDDKEEAAKKSKEDAKHYDLIRKDLDAAKEARKASEEDFFKYLKDKYFPKDEVVEISEENLKTGNRKRLILKILSRIHPDHHQSKARHEILLHEELTKMLNAVYENYK